MPIEQSLPICCTLASLGGVLEVAATALTAVPAVREHQGKDELSAWRYWCSVAGNVSLQLLGSIMSHLLATWFGPVSMVVPFFYSATMLSNMLIFGALLGLASFTKNMEVGTYVIVCAVILLPVVGPTPQDDQDITLILKHWYASVWFSLLLMATTVTGVILALVDIEKYYKPSSRTVVLLIARAASIAVNLTVSRSFIFLDPETWVFSLFLVLKIVSGGIYTYAIVVQSTAIGDQARFVPLNTTCIIVVNALTGIILWEDWKVMQSWYGYACVFCLLGLGIDLLLSSTDGVPLLNEDNPKFGVHHRASVILHRKQRSQSMYSLNNNYGSSNSLAFQHFDGASSSHRRQHSASTYEAIPEVDDEDEIERSFRMVREELGNTMDKDQDDDDEHPLKNDKSGNTPTVVAFAHDDDDDGMVMMDTSQNSRVHHHHHIPAHHHQTRADAWRNVTGTHHLYHVMHRVMPDRRRRSYSSNDVDPRRSLNATIPRRDYFITAAGRGGARRHPHHHHSEDEEHHHNLWEHPPPSEPISSTPSLSKAVASTTRFMSHVGKTVVTTPLNLGKQAIQSGKHAIGNHGTVEYSK